MKPSTKAVLLSGLVFPGAGHFYLKKTLRGSILSLCTLIAMSIVIQISYARALSVVEKMSSGEVAYDATAISEMAANTTADGQEPTLQVALLVVSSCWIIGILDAWRLGRIRNRVLQT
ncbi:MAG: hypothetical protein OEW68_11555 [Gammaproteobacteria bacterium]|nr:hypothetical protein [Gammaproteobacteria bacterium]MDH4315469.1 hypothetical protein [Gammaproteobacteria bacterium]MDH5214272.1 hypothetical protein [Gammaproteobacteria bacterium]MDH5500932.1 hypothetical protein [Gammaproteobacteria bacterium]